MPNTTHSHELNSQSITIFALHNCEHTMSVGASCSHNDETKTLTLKPYITNYYIYPILQRPSVEAMIEYWHTIKDVKAEVHKTDISKPNVFGEITYTFHVNVQCDIQTDRIVWKTNEETNQPDPIIENKNDKGEPIATLGKFFHYSKDDIIFTCSIGSSSSSSSSSSSIPSSSSKSSSSSSSSSNLSSSSQKPSLSSEPTSSSSSSSSKSMPLRASKSSSSSSSSNLSSSSQKLPSSSEPPLSSSSSIKQASSCSPSNSSRSISSTYSVNFKEDGTSITKND